MQYLDDLISLFVANYSQPYPVELPGLGVCTISGGTVAPSTQPTDSPWLRFSVTAGSTFNATIGTVDSRLKSEPFNINIQIFIPRTTSTSETAYTYSVPATVERHLDGFMLTDGFNASGEEAVISSAQDEPKFKSTPPPEAGDNWILTLVSYQYLYRYV